MEALNEELAALEWEAKFVQTQPTARRRNIQRIVHQQRAAMTKLGKERDRIRFTLPVNTIAAVAAATAETVVTIPVALICGVIAGAGAIGAGAIQAIDGLGANRGIVITKAWIGDPIIWHQ